MASHLQGSWLQAIRLYMGLTTVLHFVWELLQLPLYTIWYTGNFREIVFSVLHCTAGDFLIASSSLVVSLIVIGTRAWPSGRFFRVMTATLVIGIGYTVYSEWANTILRQTWAYSELMPTVPVLGTGLSPLTQWLIVPVVGFAAVRCRYKRPNATSS